MIRRKKRPAHPAAPFPEWVRLDRLPIQPSRARYAQKRGLQVLNGVERAAVVARMETYRAALKTIATGSVWYSAWADLCLSGQVHAKTLARCGYALPNPNGEKRLAYDIPHGLTMCRDEDEAAIRMAAQIAIIDISNF